MPRDAAALADRAEVCIAALFHDLGKATAMFQAKLDRAMRSRAPERDPVRHELYSAAVWDILFGDACDESIRGRVEALVPGRVGDACGEAGNILARVAAEPGGELPFAFIDNPGSIAHAIGMLVLAHHGLPDGDSSMRKPLSGRHVGGNGAGLSEGLALARGSPFWMDEWWLSALRSEAALLRPAPLGLFSRAALMMADHLGSSRKGISAARPAHLANTAWDGKARPGDDLGTHVRRVHAAAIEAAGFFENELDGLPALAESEMPPGIAAPASSGEERFRWQGEAARAARALCEGRAGGFFAAILAGTGTGKTRGAPTVLAGAVFGDAIPRRRSMRVSLGLGLRVLADQSAREYVEDLGFDARDVSVLVGQAPLAFSRGDGPDEDDGPGTGGIVPDWLDADMAGGREARPLPGFCEDVIQASGRRAAKGRMLLEAPVMTCTIDHLMGVASPVNSRFLLQSLRVATSDLILDEIDQFDGEDIAAIGRLVYQFGAAGRRVVVMSATLTKDIFRALCASYRAGWACFSEASGIPGRVNLLVAGDAPGSCGTNARGEADDDVFESSVAATLKSLARAPAYRRGEILPPRDDWRGLVDQVDESCHRLHDATCVDVGGFRVSFGMVRLTRVSHVAAMAAQLPRGPLDGRLRLVACLHSQFPRLHRGWIEDRLRRALARKESDSGLDELCRSEKVFDRARAAGAGAVEIVLVASPVIETGNDLDFDWAVLDPVSARSIVQSAGRVRRHRPASGSAPNVLVLGRSPIAMEGGRLAWPGVETPPPRATRVGRKDLGRHSGARLFRELAGDASMSVISASLVLDRAVRFPQRDEESKLARDFVSTEGGQPLGRFLNDRNARMVRNMVERRMFRRADARAVLFEMVGEDFDDAEWHRDLAPGTRESSPQPVDRDAFDLHEPPGDHQLFRDYTRPAWKSLAGGREPSGKDVRRLMRAEVPDHSSDDVDLAVAYSDFTGFTRGSSRAIFSDFGKSVENEDVDG